MADRIEIGEFRLWLDEQWRPGINAREDGWAVPFWRRKALRAALTERQRLYVQLCAVDRWVAAAERERWDG